MRDIQECFRHHALHVTTGLQDCRTLQVVESQGVRP
jgi:hypothetical protein